MVSILSLHKPHTHSKYEMESTEPVKPVKKIIRKKKIVVKKKKEEPEPEPEPEPEQKEQEPQEKSVEYYQTQMTDLERKTMLIAQDHLGTSFNMEKSTGYLKYLET
jgi:hypothetical protein